MQVSIYNTDKWIGDILLRKGKILANGNTSIIYRLLLDLRKGNFSNKDIIEKLPEILKKNNSEFAAKIVNASKDKSPISLTKEKINKNTINAPENFVQDQYLSPRRHW